VSVFACLLAAKVKKTTQPIFTESAGTLSSEFSEHRLRSFCVALGPRKKPLWSTLFTKR